MSCFSCIPPPASLKPRKIYNILVPDVFPIKCPADADPIPHAIQRKIGKLQEYVQRNPERIPKVSAIATPGTHSIIMNLRLDIIRYLGG